VADLQEQLSPLQKVERDELEAAYRLLLRRPEGKRVLFDILELSGLYQSAFTGENNATNFTLGMQETGKRLVTRLDQIDPRFYPLLLLDRAEIKAMDLAAAERSTNKEQEDDDISA
jgi:hypothetical protein